jgi:hypothetical protein
MIGVFGWAMIVIAAVVAIGSVVVLASEFWGRDE